MLRADKNTLLPVIFCMSFKPFPQSSWIFQYLIFLCFGQEKKKLENFAFRKFYRPHSFCKWVWIKFLLFYIKRSLLFLLVCLLVIWYLCLHMTFHNLTIPFYTLGRQAAATRPKLQIQNMSLSLFFRQHLDRL